MKWKLTWKKQEAVEVGVLLLLLTVLSAVVFGGWLEISAKNYPIAFICGPIVIWTAFRFTQRETATGIFILSVIAVWGTVRGFGPFVGQNENQSLLTVQSWTAVLALTAMALSAGMAERRRIEDELQQQKSIVEAANRTKDHFLAMLSHELRTPLTPVISVLESLETEPTQTGDTKASLAMIRRNIELETQLIDDLLDFTRIARDKMQLRFAPVDAHQAVSNVVEICRAEARSKNLHVHLNLRAKSCHVTADAAKFSRSFGTCLRTRSNSRLKPETSQSPQTIHQKPFSMLVCATPASAWNRKLCNAFSIHSSRATARLSIVLAGSVWGWPFQNLWRRPTAARLLHKATEPIVTQVLRYRWKLCRKVKQLASLQKRSLTGHIKL